MGLVSTAAGFLSPFFMTTSLSSSSICMGVDGAVDVDAKVDAKAVSGAVATNIAAVASRS